MRGLPSADLGTGIKPVRDQQRSALRCWSRTGFMPVPRSADGSPLTDWQSVSVGRVHTCGIRAGGVLTCFGANADGQLDLIHSSSRFITVSAGGYHTCAVDDVYRVHCVGRVLRNVLDKRRRQHRYGTHQQKQ